ncbi:hypothetical protein JCM11251_006939 [Rhodosporidiobolus azoricus]
MAAFQQRRQATARPPPIYSPLSSDNLAATLATSDDEGVLLFSPPPRSDTLADSSWALVPPPARAGRTISFRSDASTASRSTVSTGTTDSLGSPQDGGGGSLLPAHGGDGVFLPAESLAQSDLLLPSVYATATDDLTHPHLGGPSSPSLASTTSSSFPFSSHARRPSVQSQISFASTFSATASSAGDSAGWGPLTEQNLAASVGWARRVASAVEEERADDERSAGYTSGSEEEQEGVQRERRLTRASRGNGPSSAEMRASDLQARLDDAEWALSPAALSAGLFPSARTSSRSSTRGRLPHPTSFSQSSLPFSPIAARTSLSSTTSGSGSVARYKRRHRRAGGRAGSAGSQKRASTDAGVVVVRVGRWDEEERLARMRELLRARERELQEKEALRKAEEKVLFGHAVLSYLHIPPSHLALIGSAPSTAHPTPTPSRNASPSRLHGFERFSAQASADARFASQAGLDTAADVSDAETEHPASPDSDNDEADWRSFSTTAPAKTLRGPPLPKPSSSSSPHWRSRSAVDLPGLGLTLRPVHSHKPSRPSLTTMRRSSSFGGVVSSAADAMQVEVDKQRELGSSTASESAPIRPVKAEAGRKLSHEERILLGQGPSSDAAGGEGAAWGGDLDSFELALSYWRGFLKRLGVYAPAARSSAQDGKEVEERLTVQGGPVVQVYP